MRTRSSNIKLYLGAAILLLTGTGTIFAGNILGSGNNNTVEFGAGQYFVQSCNSWISLNLIPGETGTYGAPAGYSPLLGIEVNGLDTLKCGNTRLTIKSESKSNSKIPIVHTDGGDELCLHGQCPAQSSETNAITLDVATSGAVTLEGQDVNRKLNFVKTAKSYQILFLKPAALASDVQNFIIQSENLKL